MDFTLTFTYILVFGYLGLTVYLANQAQIGRQTLLPPEKLLYAAPILMALTALFAITATLQSAQYAALTEAERQQFEGVSVPDISAGALAISLLICGTGTSIMLAVMNSSETRTWLQRHIFAREIYAPQSQVHTAAIVFTVLIAGISTIDFLLSGGTSGLAESIETRGISAGAPLFQAFLQIAFAFLGIGFAIRRELSAALARLGLRWPNGVDFRQALSTTGRALVVVFVFSFVQSLLLSPEQIEAQSRAADSIAASFSTLPLALLLAISASFGEEIFFRGALQPVFGLIPTTLFFTVLHSQVLLTPSIVVIFIVGYLFGRLRRDYSTTAAIMAHFLYNFVLLVLSITAAGGGNV